MNFVSCGSQDFEGARRREQVGILAIVHARISYWISRRDVLAVGHLPRPSM